MRRIIDIYHHLLTLLLVLTVAILIVPVTLQILSRARCEPGCTLLSWPFEIVVRFAYLVPTFDWTEELARLLFVWMIMLGAMIGIRESTHFDADVLPQFSKRVTAGLQIVTHLFVLVFALVFVWWGIKFVQFGWNQLSELAELPMPYIFVAWPLTGITWVLFLGEKFWANLKTVAGR